MDAPDAFDRWSDHDLPELCDVCGAVLEDGEELYALVPDSSAVHAFEPGFDGKRVLTACGVDHLAEIVGQYRRRPFVPEEQWAGKVCRALEQTGEPLSLEELAAISGLSQEQVDRGVDWHNARVRALQRRWDGPAR